MIDNDLRESERRFWLEGEAFFRDGMHRDAVMVLPAPGGIMDVRKVIAGIKDAPRWDEVEMTEVKVSQVGYTAVLAYEARARRDGTSYAALCGSTYVREGGRWLLLMHQQLPQ